MKNLILLAFLFFAFAGQAQKWRDSLNAARSEYLKGRYSDALEHYKSAQRNAPSDVDLSAEAGQTAMKLRDFKKAEEFYRESAGRENDPQKRAVKLKNTGNAQMGQKKYEDAIESYKQSLRLDPKNDQTRYNLSEAMRRKKQKDQEDQQKKNQDQEENENNQDENKDQGDNNKDGSGQNQQQDQNGNQQKNDKSGNSSSNSEGNSSSKLNNRKVEKTLDELMKQEAQTKRKTSGGMKQEGGSNSGKDW